MLTRDERGNVIHWTGTIQRIHGNQILKLRGLQFTQVFLHSSRLELERSGRLAAAIELIGQRIFQAHMIDIEIFTCRLTYIVHSIFDDAEGLQSEEVHFDQSSLLNDRAFILRTEKFLARFLVFGRTDRNDIGNRLRTNDDTAGMNAGIADITFQHLGIFQRIACEFVTFRSGFLQFRHIFDGVGQRNLLHFGNLIRDKLCQTIGL